MRTYVIAANMQHFRAWCHDHNVNPRDHNYVYVRDETVLFGLSPENCKFEFYSVPGYWHPRFTEIYEQIQIIESMKKHGT